MTTTNFMYITYSILVPAALNKVANILKGVQKQTDRESKTGKTVVVYR